LSVTKSLGPDGPGRVTLRAGRGRQWDKPRVRSFFTGLFGLYDTQNMPLAAQLAVYVGIPLLSVSWYAGLLLAFSNARLSRAYLNLRRPLDGALAGLFFFLGIKLIL